VVKPESFFVDDVSGPLGADEIDRAEQWGRKLAALVQEENRAQAR
jgi:hypothetical protein